MLAVSLFLHWNKRPRDRFSSASFFLVKLAIDRVQNQIAKKNCPAASR
jgi:hypothetical protein